MGSPTVAALPAFWAGVPFGDPACVLIAAGVLDTLCRGGGALPLPEPLPAAVLAARGENGHLDDFVFTGTDGTPWRVRCDARAERAVLHAEPMAASIARAERYMHSELLRRVGDGLRHELRNALNRLALRAQLLERELGAGVAGPVRTLPVLRERIAALDQLQERILDDWCRMSELPQPVDPVELIEALRPLWRAALAGLPADLEVGCGGRLPTVAACPWRLQRLLLGGILAAAERAGAGAALLLRAAGDGGRLHLDLTVRAGSGGPPAAPELAASLGALVWGLAQGRDLWEPRADGGWHMRLG